MNFFFCFYKVTSQSSFLAEEFSISTAQTKAEQTLGRSEPHLPTIDTNTNSQNALCLRLVWASVLQCPLHLPARTPSFPVSMQIYYAICVFHYNPQTEIVAYIYVCILLACSRWKPSEECCGFIKKCISLFIHVCWGGDTDAHPYLVSRENFDWM